MEQNQGKRCVRRSRANASEPEKTSEYTKKGNLKRFPFYMPVTSTNINIIGTINFNKILKTTPKKLSPKIFFQK